MKTTPSVAALLEKLERELHDPGVRKSQRVTELLAEEFFEFGSSGRTFNKAHILQALRSEPAASITSAEYKVRSLSENVALVTYRSASSTRPEVQVLRSSIWRRQGTAWQMVFHQGTPTTVKPDDQLATHLARSTPWDS